MRKNQEKLGIKHIALVEKEMRDVKELSEHWFLLKKEAINWKNEKNWKVPKKKTETLELLLTEERIKGRDKQTKPLLEFI